MTNSTVTNMSTCCPLLEKLLAMMESGAKEARNNAAKYAQLNRDFSQNLAELIKHVESTPTRARSGRYHGQVKDFLLDHSEEIRKAREAGVGYVQISRAINKAARTLKLQNFSASHTYVRRIFLNCILPNLKEKADKDVNFKLFND